MVSGSDGEAVTAVIWKDNKCVTLLSTLSGKLPETQVKRFDKKNKTRNSVSCSNLVGTYNKHMDGVNLLDAQIPRYRTIMFYHFFDVMMDYTWKSSWTQHVDIPIRFSLWSSCDYLSKTEE